MMLTSALQASFRVPLECLHQRMIGCDTIGAARESRFHLRFEVAVGRGDFVEQRARFRLRAFGAFPGDGAPFHQ